MDIFTPAKRSDIMSRIRSTGTKPEVRLHELAVSIVGRRRRMIRNATALLGTPDLFVPSLGLVVFVDGCFFHGCPMHGHIPKSNSAFWEQKIERNVARDSRYRRSLRRDGYSVWRFWEHELKPARIESAAKRLSIAVKRCIEME